jgi:hypothetical protein
MVLVYNECWNHSNTASFGVTRAHWWFDKKKIYKNEKTILYVSIFSSDHYIYFIDVELLIYHGTYFLSNAFQEGTNLLNTFTNNSNLYIPKFKEAFDIGKNYIRWYKQYMR